MAKVLLSFFDYTGNWSRPYRNDIVFEVHTFDIKNGQDIMDFNPAKFISDYQHQPLNYFPPDIYLMFAVPCTDYALCGSKIFAQKDMDGRTAKSQILVAKVKEIIDWFDKAGLLKMWVIENPRTRIHTLNKWIGKIKFRFNPCDFAEYDEIPDNSRYNKDTWLFGSFNNPIKKRLEPFEKENPGWKKLGGKSERTKELRSITPMGFANAFYQANK